MRSLQVLASWVGGIPYFLLCVCLPIFKMWQAFPNNDSSKKKSRHSSGHVDTFFFCLGKTLVSKQRSWPKLANVHCLGQRQLSPQKEDSVTRKSNPGTFFAFLLYFHVLAHWSRFSLLKNCCPPSLALGFCILSWAEWLLSFLVLERVLSLENTQRLNSMDHSLTSSRFKASSCAPGSLCHLLLHSALELNFWGEYPVFVSHLL